MSHWQLSIGGSFAATHVAFVGTPEWVRQLALTGDASLTRFLRAVRDDDTPRSLQPFLQRSGSFRLAVGGNGTFSRSHFFADPESGNPADGFDDQTSVDRGFTLDAAFDGYALPWLAFTAGFGYGFDAVQYLDKTHHLNPRGGAAVRFGDTRIDLGYSFDVYADSEGGFYPPRWGTLSLDLESVIAKHVDLQLGGKAYNRGAGGSGRAEWFIGKNVGLFLGAFGYVTRVDYDQPLVHTDYGFNLGTDCWVGPRVRLDLSYQLSESVVPRQTDGDRVFPPISTALTNKVIAAVVVRLP